MEVGDTFVSNQGVTWTVLVAKNRSNVTVCSEHGTIKHGLMKDYEKGQVRCYFHPSVHGKGYIGIGRHVACGNSKGTLPYNIWRNMLERCYSPRLHAKFPTYIGCEVTEAWLNYQVFADWFQENYIEGFHLDKDIKEFGNKIYCPEKCLFVSSSVNSFITDREGARGTCVLGVCKTPYDKFVAQCQETTLERRTDRGVYLGTYATEQEAFEVYAHYKESLVGALDTTDEIKVYLQSFLQARHSDIREQKGW